MINSIQHFGEFGIRNLEKTIENFMKNPTNLAELVYGVRDEVVDLGLRILKESFEECNRLIREDGKRKEKWKIVRTDHKKLITSLGTVEFEKTMIKHKESGQECYLLDRLLELGRHERLTEDAEAAMLGEAVCSSYRKGGEAVGPASGVSKQTVMNKVHRLCFPPTPIPKGRKVVDYLYIDADEDHVHLQFEEKKGDLVVGKNHWKNNCVFAKLVYVYEGIEPAAPKSERSKLVNPHYFSGVYEGDGNKQLWDEVYHYIDSHYDLERVKKIYLNGDGGAWIKSGKKQISGLVYVLDGFHMSKYLNKMTRHLSEDAPMFLAELRNAIKGGTKAGFNAVVERIEARAETASAQRRIEEGAGYVRSNWTSAKLRAGARESVLGCSAEGHVSHVLSDRMSSRPMGWSRLGADRMSRLRAYHFNGGGMLELVRLQKEEVPKAAGLEEVILSCTQVLRSEGNRHRELGKYSDLMSHSLSTATKKKLAIRSNLMGL